MIAVQDTYGDSPVFQHMSACSDCGAVVFVAAAYADGSSLDTREQHRQWHERLATSAMSGERDRPGRCTRCNADISTYAPGLTLCAVCEDPNG